MLATRTQVRNIVKKTAWSHLPNAAHIDRVLASVKSHPLEWGAAWDAAGKAARKAAWVAAGKAAHTAARNAAWVAARGAAYDAARGAAYDAARGVAWVAAWVAARNTLAALIAWDHSVKYLSMKPSELKIWYELSEDPACLLLLTYAHAKQLIADKGLTVNTDSAIISTVKQRNLHVCILDH